MTCKDKRPAEREASPPGDAASSASSGPALRQRAEAAFRGNPAQSPEKLEALSPQETQLMLHELHVHQIELEMQNEELRRAQVELDASRARYFDLYDLAPVGYCTISEPGLILEANLTAATLLGVARGVLVKRPISQFIFKEDQDIYYLHSKRLFETSEPQAFELRMVKNDGTQFWAHLAATAAHDADSAPELRAVLTDNTARKQIEAEQKLLDQRLRDQQFYTRSLIEFNIDAIMTTDPSGIITDVNKQMEVLTGCTRDELIGARFKSYFTDPELAEAGINLALANKKVTDYELTVRARDGKETVVSFNASTFYDRDRRLQGVFAAARDITEREHLYQMLQERNVELEGAKSMAEKASLAKSDFLSSMSHELRTPLNAILGFAQVIESAAPPPTPSQKRGLDQILKAGWYLLELINEILDLAKIESGRLTLSREPVSLNQLILECQTMIEPQAQRRGIGMHFPRFDTPSFVLADRTRLKQVLINLLFNAIKYNRPGGTVALECAAAPPNSIRISVRDTGEGLPPEKLAQLFQPFNRLGKEAGIEEGTGIGLVVAKQLVKLMGGIIGVDSTVGVGTVFWIELSLCERPQIAPEKEAASATSHRPSVTTGAQQHTLLYVEDNPANLQLVEELIARRPELRLLTAADGNLGIALAREFLPEVILMDINLPGINGVEAMRILRADPATAHIPVVAISANAIPGDIKKGLEAGFFRYLTKPIVVSEFMDALDVVLKLAKTESTLAAKKEQG